MSQDCACCTTPAAAVPRDIQNRPWLSAIAYRIGTFATFRKAILDQLSHTHELAALTARVPDDYTITAIELWSAVADVLTFYQERIANEAFLRTAIERDSLLRLVRLIDYQLAPGSAATVELAFTLETGANALIPARTRVQSVPAEGEKAQKFETLVALAAKAALNRVRILPRPGALQIAGLTVATPTSEGQRAAIVAADMDAIGAAAQLTKGDRVALYSPDALEVMTVQETASREELLTVTWTSPIKKGSFAAAFDADDVARRAVKLGRSFHLFGFDMPPRVIVPISAVIGGVTHHFLTQLFPDFSLEGDNTGPDLVALDGRYDGLRPGVTVLGVAALSGGVVRAYPFRIDEVDEAQVERQTLPSPMAPTPPPSTTGTVTRVKLTPLTVKTLADLTAGTDIRSIVLHELLGDPLRFWPYAFDQYVMSGTLFVPGRRTGASTIQIGRTIDKGAYKAGAIVDVRDYERGRRILLSDAITETPVGGTIVSADLVGTQIEVEAAGADPAANQLGFAADQSTRTTVIASGRHGLAIAFPNPRRELTVQIGTLPPQTVVLSPALIGFGAPANVAQALQTAIRATVPGAPTVARALVFVVDSALVVAPGIPGDAIRFAPSASDPDTVSALGFGADDVTYLDGIVTAPIAALAGTSVNGSVKVTVGIVPPAVRPITTTITNAAALAAAITSSFTFTGPTGESFQVVTKTTDDDRVIVLPPLPRRMGRAFVRVIVDLDKPVVLDAATSVLLGNVAPASHGETVANEVMGDGDGSLAFQRFPLKKKPVTYVPSAGPGGVSSSLEVFVNGVRWSEAPTLYGAGPRDAFYINRLADDGTMTVQFGDGVTGSRLPSGRGNVVARYRTGTGLAGRVRAATITSLLDRPTGVKNVTNFLPSDGGAEPETMARARQTAPGTVRTFGRAVALRDFEDTALLAGEVAKAVATWVWTGERRAIHVTVAAQQGATFLAQGLARLRATLATERDPNHKLILDNYSAVAVVIAATLYIEDQYVRDTVLDAAKATLLDALSFEKRQFAQPVYSSDIIAALQGVNGVRAVDLDTLDLKSADPAFRLAHGVDPALGQPQPRLLILPARPAGSATAVLPAELAWVEAPAQDLTLRAVGGITL